MSLPKNYFSRSFLTHPCPWVCLNSLLLYASVLGKKLNSRWKSGEGTQQRFSRHFSHQGWNLALQNACAASVGWNKSRLKRSPPAYLIDLDSMLWHQLYEYPQTSKPLEKLELLKGGWEDETRKCRSIFSSGLWGPAFSGGTCYQSGATEF